MKMNKLGIALIIFMLAAGFIVIAATTRTAIPYRDQDYKENKTIHNIWNGSTTWWCINGDCRNSWTSGTGSSNCSVDNSCSLITYDSELNYVNNCTVNGSCSDIIYHDYNDCVLLTGSADLCDGSDDGTGSSNCSIDQTCSLITYDSELSYINNCTLENSCSLITYDSELSYINNCSNAECSIDNIGTLDGYEATALLDNTFNNSPDIWAIANNGTLASKVWSIANVNLSCVELTGSADLCDGSDDGGGTGFNNCSASLSCGLVTYDSELSYINNCSVDNSCSFLSYDSETFNGTLASKIWSINNVNLSCIELTGSADLCDGSDDGAGSSNCSVSLSCEPITYDSELAYISNCSVDQTCDSITYDTELSYIQNCSDAECNIDNIGTLDGYEASELLGGGDGTGGWVNSSTWTNTSLNVKIGELLIYENTTVISLTSIGGSGGLRIYKS